MENGINTSNITSGVKVTSPRSTGNGLSASGSYMYTNSSNIVTQREKPPILPKYQGYTSTSAGTAYRLLSLYGRPKTPETLSTGAQPASGDATSVRFFVKLD